MTQLSEWINVLKLALFHQNNQSTFSDAGFFDLLDYAESNQFAARVDALQDGVFDIFDRTKGLNILWKKNIFTNLGITCLRLLPKQKYTDYPHFHKLCFFKNIYPFGLCIYLRIVFWLIIFIFDKCSLKSLYKIFIINCFTAWF